MDPAADRGADRKRGFEIITVYSIGLALTATNVLLGLGTALSPRLIAIFLDIVARWYLPLIASAGLVGHFVFALLQPVVVRGSKTRQSSGRVPNPTLTAMANAIRVGEHLLERTS